MRSPSAMLQIKMDLMCCPQNLILFQLEKKIDLPLPKFVGGYQKTEKKFRQVEQSCVILFTLFYDCIGWRERKEIWKSQVC
jgi:hypothetical protein